MQYLNRAMHEQGYQESSVDKAQQLNSADLINHHHLVIIRCDDSADHHKAVVFRHDDSAGHHIKSSIGPFRSDDSASRSQRAKELSSQRNQDQYSMIKLSTKIRMEINNLPKATKEQKNYGLTIAKIHEQCNNFALLNSGDSSLQTVRATVKVNHRHNSDPITKAEVPQIWSQRQLKSGSAISDLTTLSRVALLDHLEVVLSLFSSRGWCRNTVADPDPNSRGAAEKQKLPGNTCVTLNGSGIQLAVGSQPLRLQNHNFGLAQRIMVKRLATSPHDPLGITDSACKNQLVVSVQYGPFIIYIPIRSTTIDSIGYPRMRASGKSSTTKHRLLHASGSHPIPPPNDHKTNQYNQDLGLIHSTNGNHLESPNEGSSIDHQVTIHLHDQNITMFPTNETWYFASQMLVSSSGGLILIFTAQSTRNKFIIHSDY
ncbi:hypothetical protein F511_16819 [Dorcoceras hygrometricum]|uniref:Uncharacterized protein n=1 Tax=Dorcoceras hygrometricum TaxID=472368 RepID=A0A2Z7CQ53_9LAMI|nr:hypothetical protein F511_16819 [Dorcoceras hygrometricum]